MKRILAILVILGVVGVLLGACAPAAAPAPPPAPTTLRLGVVGLGNETLDTLMGGGTFFLYGLELYDRLVGLNEEGIASNPDTGVAYKWEVSPDGKHYKFYIRKGVKFHNGWGEVTADDVKFSLERLMLPESNATTFKQAVDRIETPNPYEVDVYLKRPLVYLIDGVLCYYHGSVLPKKYIEEKGVDYFRLHPIGTGPYKFVEQVMGDHILMEKNPDHWLVKNFRYDRIEWMIVPEEATRIGMLKTGELDMIPVSIDSVKGLKDDFNIITRKGAEVTVLTLHTIMNPNSVLRNFKVREALALAINKEEIGSSIYKGMAHVFPGSALIFKVTPGYVPLTPYPYDPEQAKKLLAEAGYPGGEGLPQINIYSAPSSGLPGDLKVAELVAGYFSAIGVKNKIIPMSYGAFRTLWHERKLQDPATYVYTTGETVWANASWLQQVFMSTGFMGTADDPKLDALIQKVNTAKSVDDFASTMTSIERYMHGNLVGQIPLVEVDNVYGASKSVPSWNIGRLANYWGLRNLYWIK